MLKQRKFSFKRFKKYYNKDLKKSLNSFDYILIVRDPCFFNEKQLTCCKRIVARFSKKFKSFFFFFFKPYFFLTSKPSESRMGGGKGSLSFKIFSVLRGQPFLGFKKGLFSDLEFFFFLSYLSSKTPFRFSLVRSSF